MCATSWEQQPEVVAAGRVGSISVLLRDGWILVYKDWEDWVHTCVCSSRIMSCYFTVWAHFYYLRYAQTLLDSLCWLEWEIGSSDDWINHLQISFNQPLYRISHLLVVARLRNPFFLFWGTAVVLLCWQPSRDSVHRERFCVGTGKRKKRQNECSKNALIIKSEYLISLEHLDQTCALYVPVWPAWGQS